MTGRWSRVLERERIVAIVGADSLSPPPGRGIGTVIAVLGLAAVIIGLSPGARFFYKHGRLPE